MLYGDVAAAEQFKLPHCDLKASEAARGLRAMYPWPWLPGMHWKQTSLARLCRMWCRIGHFRVHEWSM